MCAWSWTRKAVELWQSGKLCEVVWSYRSSKCSCPLRKHIQRRMDTSVSLITHHLNDWNHWVCHWIRVTGLAGVSNRECKWPYVCLSMPLLITAQDSDSFFPLRWLLSLLCLTLSFLFAIPSVTVLLFHVIISYLSYFCVSPSFSSSWSTFLFLASAGLSTSFSSSTSCHTAQLKQAFN